MGDEISIASDAAKAEVTDGGAAKEAEAKCKAKDVDAADTMGAEVAKGNQDFANIAGGAKETDTDGTDFAGFAAKDFVNTANCHDNLAKTYSTDEPKTEAKGAEVGPAAEAEVGVVAGMGEEGGGNPNPGGDPDPQRRRQLGAT